MQVAVGVALHALGGAADRVARVVGGGAGGKQEHGGGGGEKTADGKRSGHFLAAGPRVRRPDELDRVGKTDLF